MSQAKQPKQAKHENDDFFEALALMEKEKGIPAEYLVDTIKTAISIAICSISSRV